MHLLCIDSGKVVSSFLVVGLPGLDHVIENHQNTVTDSYSRTLGPSSRTNPKVLFPRITLSMRRRLRRLDEHCFGPAIALTDAATEVSASRFVVARTDADPRCGMSGIGKVTHVPAKFAE